MEFEKLKKGDKITCKKELKIVGLLGGITKDKIYEISHIEDKQEKYISLMMETYPLRIQQELGI